MDGKYNQGVYEVVLVGNVEIFSLFVQWLARFVFDTNVLAHCATVIAAAVAVAVAAWCLLMLSVFFCVCVSGCFDAPSDGISY